MRLRAHTATERRAREAELNAALKFAREQGATLFELRCLVDLFALVGDTRRAELEDAITRIPGDAQWPELTRAQRLLG
jgi:hypothetical protein